MSTYKDLKAWLEADRLALGHVRAKPRFFGDEEWKFQVLLRKAEYYSQGRSLRMKLLYYWTKYRKHNLSVRLGFTIPEGCCGPGLQIMHIGTIVINSKVVIGKNCRIHTCVNIGEDREGNAPVIGDNVYIGPGVKMFGNIVIADNVVIGANAVVNKSCTQPGAILAGVPAKTLETRAPHKL